MEKKTKQVPVPVKEKNKFKDKFFAYLLAGCMIFWTIASVLGIVGFANSIEKEKAVESSTAVAVSADNVHQVRDKKGATNRQVKDKQKSINITPDGTYSFDFECDDFNSILFYDGENGTLASRIINSVSIQRLGTSLWVTVTNSRVHDDDVVTYSYQYNGYTEIIPIQLSVATFDDDFFNYPDQELFIDVPSGVLPSTNDYYPDSYSIGCIKRNYTDFADYYIEVNELPISIPSNLPAVQYRIFFRTSFISALEPLFTPTGEWYLPTSSYYSLTLDTFSGAVSFYSFLHNSNYNYGYNAGFNEGKLEGRNDGYQSGYTAGQSVGYNQGYAQGLADNGGEWSFRSLLTAVVDTPVQVFTDLFNFEILGINLTGFFLGLFSIALCLGVIKLIF